jgi:hypothetical protein
LASNKEVTMRLTKGQFRKSITRSAALLGFVPLLAFLQAFAQHATIREQSRKEGVWEVTPVGRVHTHAQSGDRLLVTADSCAPELWDTKLGKLVARLSQHQDELVILRIFA